MRSTQCTGVSGPAGTNVRRARGERHTSPSLHFANSGEDRAIQEHFSGRHGRGCRPSGAASPRAWVTVLEKERDHGPRPQGSRRHRHRCEPRHRPRQRGGTARRGRQCRGRKPRSRAQRRGLPRLERQGRPRARHSVRHRERRLGPPDGRAHAGRVRPARYPGQQCRAGEPGRPLHAQRYRMGPKRARKWGRIINVTGGAGRQPQPNAVATGMNNAAILNLTKAMANDLAKDGILLNSVVPTSTLTERVEEAIRKTAAQTGKAEAAVLAERGAKFPLGRLGKPEEVAAVVAFLASERASYV